MADKPPSTLYPKITNHIHEVVKTLRHRRNPDPSTPSDSIAVEPMAITGTIKLHGTHADIVISPAPTSTITLQSRNTTNLLPGPTSDNFGFAATMSTKRDVILRLRDQFFARWKMLNPDAELDPSLPMTIAGEWIGPGIQNGVAIAQLSRRFVIISAKVNESWVNDSEYADIEAPKDDIYNISRGGYYHSTLYTSDLQTTISELEVLAEDVATQCPFAASFGVNGGGEGLVWKLDSYISDSSLWFKTKGGKFKPTFAPPPKALSANMEEKRKVAMAAAQAWCGEQRLEQGWDYLREMGIARDTKGIGQFLKWVQSDILVEEKAYIKDNEVDDGFLRQAIIGIAKPWFLTRLASPT
jgi:hypothetical protein